MISKNTKPEDILAGARDGVEATEGDDASAEWIGPYAARFQENRVPTHKFPDKSSKAGSAYQVRRTPWGWSMLLPVLGLCYASSCVS